MNPLFGGNPQGNMFGPFGGMMNFINQLNQFQQGLRGDPQQMVQQLRQNGQMSEQQFNYFSGIANQIMPFMRR
ncbi:MAG: hypothetical protein II024_03610 [Firmicutes bacterium]|nr:hypothetical protein [Bacillota bacterium]